MTKEEFYSSLPVLVQNYQPAPGVLKKISNLTLLMLIGPSGVGKTSLIERLGLPYVASDTTRPPRPGETNGEDYHFRDDYARVKAEIKEGQFVQVAIGPGGDFYATRLSAYPNLGVAVMAVVAGVVPIFRRLGFGKTISAFIAPPSYEEWMNRLKAHQMDSDQLKQRLAEAERSLTFGLNDPETFFVLNDDLEAATARLGDLVKGKINAEQEQTAKKIASGLLTALREI